MACLTKVFMNPCNPPTTNTWIETKIRIFSKFDCFLCKTPQQRARQAHFLFCLKSLNNLDFQEYYKVFPTANGTADFVKMTMDTTVNSSIPPTIAPSAPIGSTAPLSTDQWMTELHALLQELETITAANRTLPPVFSERIDDQLVQVRLGAAASLFASLQCKNAAVAGHALRVALTCSAWALRMDLPESERDAIEIAALLHDIGMIGAPDRILLKPEPLTSDEASIMRQARKASVEILRRGCNSRQILEIVEHVSSWYDGACTDSPLKGRQIPLGARMIAICRGVRRHDHRSCVSTR